MYVTKHTIEMNESLCSILFGRLHVQFMTQ